MGAANNREVNGRLLSHCSHLVDFLSQSTLYTDYMCMHAFLDLVQSNLNNPVTHGPSMLGYNKEVAVLK